MFNITQFNPISYRGTKPQSQCTPSLCLRASVKKLSIRVYSRPFVVRFLSLGVGRWVFDPNFTNDPLERRGCPVSGILIPDFNIRPQCGKDHIDV